MLNIDVIHDAESESVGNHTRHRSCILPAILVYLSCAVALLNTSGVVFKLEHSRIKQLLA